jgi:hypothetical protein
VDRFVIELFRGYGDRVGALLLRMGDGSGGSWVELTEAAIEVLWRTVALVGLSFFVYRSLTRIGRAAASGVARRRGRKPEDLSTSRSTLQALVGRRGVRHEGKP